MKNKIARPFIIVYNKVMNKQARFKDSGLTFLLCFLLVIGVSVFLSNLIMSIAGAEGVDVSEVTNRNYMVYLSIFLSEFIFIVVFLIIFALTKNKNALECYRLKFKFDYKIFLGVVILGVVVMLSCLNLTSLINLGFSYLSPVELTNEMGEYVQVNLDTTLTESGFAADAKATGDAINEKINYPRDTEDEMILPVSEKMLTVKPDGTTDYGDIPVGDVVKELLLNAFDEDDSKTKVNITINTSGTPITGEVRSLRNTVQVLRGNQSVGMLGITDTDSLWYVSFGVSIIMPVISGHT